MLNRRLGSAAGFASFLAFFTLAAVPAPARSQTANPTIEATQVQAGAFTFSIDATIGQVGGTAYERVYDQGYKLSELEWDLEGIAMGGVQGTAGFGRFRVSLGYWGALNEGDGDMVDRDWLVLGTDDWSDESRHDNTDLDSGSIFDVNLNVRAFTWGTFSLSGILGYRHDEWKWSARGGDYTYTWDRNDDGYITRDEWRTYRGNFENDYYDDVLVIKYRQEYDVPYLGVGCEGTLGPVQLRGHLLYSTWVSGEDHDYHALRDMTFDGDFEDGDWLGAGASASWFFMPRWYATLGVEYQKFDEIRGDLTVEGEELPTGAVTFSDSGSVEMETVMLLFGVGVKF